MALVIRLSRTGKKGERKFRVVVKEKRSKRDGGFVDMLGWYEKTLDHKKKNIDMKKYSYWVSQGAQPSLTVSEIVKVK
jgi:small subunit ribosomal protein S16